MARFTAFGPDTSDEDDLYDPPKRVPPRTLKQNNLHPSTADDDGDYEDDDSEEDGPSTAGPSEMDEDDLHDSPPRTRRRQDPNALVEGEDGQYYHAHEIEKVRIANGDGRRGASQGDKTTQPIPWPQQLGLAPQTVHVKQTSLFRAPEEERAMKAQQSTITKVGQPHITWENALHRKHSRESDGDHRLATQERASFAHDIEFIPYRPSRKYARVESSASAVVGSERSMLDAGLALGRSFRPGWGPGGTLVHLGQLCSPYTPDTQTGNSSTVTLSYVPLIQTGPILDPKRPFEESIKRLEKLLEHHLMRSFIQPDTNGIPFAEPSLELTFAYFSSTFSPTDQSFEALFFRLGHVLFDSPDLRLKDDVDIEVRKRVGDIRRKAALSAWLEEAVAPSVDTDVKDSIAGSAKAIFGLLTGNQIEKACQVAMDSHNVKLATLISQAGGDYDFIGHLRSQLEIWKDERVDVHIDENMRKIYALLAGYVDVLEGSGGSGVEQCKELEISRGLDWKRVFGLHLWFGQPLDATIAEVFDSYEKHWKRAEEYALPAGSEAYVAPPIPWYSETPTGELQKPSSVWQLPDDANPPDALYSLIRLHAQPELSLSQIMSPLSFGSSPVDFSLPWHLYIILSQSMRKRDLADRDDPRAGRPEGENVDGMEEDVEVEGHSPSADVLASSYALQLEQLDLIQQAAFVLLHIEESAGREKAIKDLLARSAPRLDERITRGLVESVEIPLSWVNEAKALYALDKGDVWEAYQLYLQAGLYSAAHDIAVLQLAPEAVVRDDLELLESIFVEFTGRPVEGWHVRGKAFLDYVTIRERMPYLRAGLQEAAVPDAAQATELEELSMSIPKLIGILPDVLRDRSDPRHNVALSEMISRLTSELDAVQPLLLSQSQIRPMLVDEASMFKHVQSVAQLRFLKLVQGS